MKKLACIITVLSLLFMAASAEELNSEISKAVALELMSAVGENSEAWAAYLLGQSVSVNSVSEGSAEVSVLSWYPGDGGKAGLDDIVSNLKSSQVSGSVRYTRDEAGVFSLFGVDAFRRKIVSAASEAKTAFNGQRLRDAVFSSLFPEVYAAEGGYTQAFKNLEERYADAVSPMTLEAALSMLRPTRMTADSGPKALNIDLDTANVSTVARNAYIAAYEILKNTDKSNQYSRERMSEILWDCFIKSAASLTDADYTLQTQAHIDMEKVLSGDITSVAVIDYASRIDAELNGKLDTLQIAAGYLPSYPARNQPESGVLKGPVSGTHVAFKSPDDGYGRIVSLTVPETGQTALTLFLRSGESVDAYVPSGAYILEIGKGSEWYGEVKRFGSNAAYASSVVAIGIAQSDKYHVINIVGENASNSEGVKIPMSDDSYVEPD